MPQFKKILFPVLLVIFALFLRLWQYEYFPIGGETADEFAWTLLGASLIEERAPTSWSYFEGYKDFYYKEGIFPAPLVRPALDHPPLFSFLPGAAHAFKTEWIEYPSLKVIRLPLVLLGGANALLFWCVAQKVFPQKKWAVVASLLFATIPSIVLSSRLVVAENLLVTWTLVAWWLVLGKQRRWTIWAIALACALAVLTKISGLVVPATLAAYGLLSKNARLAKLAALGGFGGLIAFALYGVFFNWSLFVEIFFAQSSRDLGLATLQNRLFLHPTLVRHIFFDGWKIAGLFATVFALGSLGKAEKLSPLVLIAISSLLNLVFIALTAGEATFHGWYDIVLWPGLVLALVAAGKQMLEKNDGLALGFLWLLLLPAVRVAVSLTGTVETLSPLLVRLVVLIGFLPFGLQILGRPRLIQQSAVVLLGILLLANCVAILGVTQEAYWLQAAFFELPH